MEQLKVELSISSLEGTSTGNLDLNDAVFGVDFKEPLIHQVVVAHLAAARSGTSAQKNRSEVSGGGSKPWRQKGTGRARAGTIRSPIFRGGGKVFPSSTRNYDQKVNKKMYRGAMRSILSELIRQDRLRVVESVDLSAPKTRELEKKLKAAGIDDVLFIVDGSQSNLELAARNLAKVDVIGPGEINPVVLLRHENVVVLGGETMKKIEGALQ
ncbi:MAG: 50S ribosomal protein L4 [Proteobacteria bacterium]|nr:MAG: 50S ribosomal protein L4 [Pseudomonadota bacterium]